MRGTAEIGFVILSFVLLWWEMDVVVVCQGDGEGCEVQLGQGPKAMETAELVAT